MYEKVTECPICDNSFFDNYIICKDHMISQESFVITKCNKCNFLFTNPRPTQANAGKYYESEEYVSHSKTKKGVKNKLYHIVKKRALKKKLKIVNSLKPKKGQLLDIGCGTGDFLNTCQKDGWTVSGVEINPDANKVSSKLLNTNIEKSVFDIKAKDEFGVISMWHVLEHLYDLNDTLSHCKKLLQPKGRIMIAVPNHGSLDRQIYKENWAAYDLPRHLYHFDQDSMKNLLSKHKMTIDKTLPMPYDSYYVSLLSEQYVSGKSKLFKAYKTGKKSNKWAKENNNNYSSLLYIVKT